MLATTALQSTPAEARVQARGHTRVSAHSVAHKDSFRISKELPGQQGPTPGGGGGKQVDEGSPWSKPGDGGRPVPPGGIPSGPRIPADGGGKQPPTTGPINPGNLPGSRPPTQTPIPPVTGNNPGGNNTNPGKTYPGGTGPQNPDYPGGNPGGSRPPILTGNPTRVPLPPITSGGTPPISTVPTPTPIPTGSSPSPNSGTVYTHQYGQVGVYADVGAGYAPCQWFKSNYDRTGNAYWLNRYRVCLWQH
jgi:hypothetical protein